MRTEALLSALLFFTLAQLTASGACAQSLPTKKEAEALLQRAAEATDFQASDTPPFHLVAQVHYEIGGHPFDGSYELFWASPDRHRENFSMGTMMETEVALGDKLYVLRNTTTMTLPFWSIRLALRSPRHLLYGTKPNVDRVYSSQVRGENRTCVDSSDESLVREICFDPVSNQIVFLSHKLPVCSHCENLPKSLRDSFGLEMSEFLSLGTKLFPRRIIRNDFDLRIDLETKTIEQAISFAQDVFTPPVGAESRDWCSKPDTKGKLSWTFGPLVKVNPPGSIVAYYVLVGRDGKVEKSIPLRSGGISVDERLNQWFRGSRFPVLSCGNKAIEYETVQYAPIQVRRH